MEKDKGRNDLMRYDLRLQEALRGAVRSIIMDIARQGFPGDHHFYISFRTGARGVQMSDRLRAQYPDEMTIVLQHQFWDLTVGEKEFSVGLSFKQIPEKLVIPFNAITSFVDPSVHFALKFEVEAADASARPAAPQPVASIDRNEPLQEKDARAPLRLTPKAGQSETEKPAAKSKAKADAAKLETAKPDADKAEAPEKSSADAGGSEKGKIVSIDAFRKKT